MKLIRNYALLSLVVASSAFATDKIAKGTYIPASGWMKTMEVSDANQAETPEQIGSYKIYLVNRDWLSLSRAERASTLYLLTLEGSLRGKLDINTYTSDHVITTSDRGSILRTTDDAFLPVQGDLTCSNGVPMIGFEQINITSAQGTLSNLSTGTLYLSGTVNNCPGQENYLKNDFYVIPATGAVIFE